MSMNTNDLPGGLLEVGVNGLPLKQFAEEMGIKRGSIHRAIERRGLKHLLVSGYAPNARGLGLGQKQHIIPLKDLPLFKEELKDLAKTHCKETIMVEMSEFGGVEVAGTFYGFQILQKHLACRIKFGFTGSAVEIRRSDYRTLLGEEISLILCEPCKKIWEKAAIDVITVGCNRVPGTQEVFDCDDKVQVIKRSTAFFRMFYPS